MESGKKTLVSKFITYISSHKETGEKKSITPRNQPSELRVANVCKCWCWEQIELNGGFVFVFEITKGSLE